MQITRRYLIQGRVQGVGFRHFTRSAARQEGVCGWVRNLPDGDVEAVATGEPDAIDRFEQRIRQGPPSSRIDHIEVHGAPHIAATSGFDIR